MDPVLGGGLLTLCGLLCRLLHIWVASRTELRRTELQQQGLSERVRHLPPGSRLLERPGSVEVVTGVQSAELRRG